MDAAELIDSLKSGVKERLGNSLIGSFLLSWCFVNWRVPVLLFWGEATAGRRIASVAEYGVSASHFELWILPLLVACFYVFAFPHPQRWIAAYTESQRKATREAVWKARGETPPTPQDVERSHEAFAAVKRRNDVLSEDNRALARKASDSESAASQAALDLRTSTGAWDTERTRLEQKLESTVKAREAAEADARERLIALQAMEAEAHKLGLANDPGFPSGVGDGSHAGTLRAAIERAMTRRKKLEEDLERASQRHREVVQIMRTEDLDARALVSRVATALGFTAEEHQKIESSVERAGARAAGAVLRSLRPGASPGATLGAASPKPLADLGVASPTRPASQVDVAGLVVPLGRMSDAEEQRARETVLRVGAALEAHEAPRPPTDGPRR